MNRFVYYLGMIALGYLGLQFIHLIIYLLNYKTGEKWNAPRDYWGDRPELAKALKAIRQTLAEARYFATNGNPERAVLEIKTADTIAKDALTKAGFE